MDLDLHQLKQAIALLGGDYETKLTIKQFADGKIHAWVAEYPEEGSVQLVPATEAMKEVERELDLSFDVDLPTTNTLAIEPLGRLTPAPGAERHVFCLDVGLTQAEVDEIWAAAVKRMV
jgi:hypothetical protein